MSVLLATGSQTFAQSNRDFRAEFDAFKKQSKREYTDFRKKCLMDYTEFVRKAWKEFGAEPPVPLPKEEMVEPVLVPQADAQTNSWFSKLFGRKKKKDEKRDSVDRQKPKEYQHKNEQLSFAKVVEPIPQQPQPQPLAKVEEQPEKANDYYAFSVFGTPCKVRIGENCKVGLKSLDNNAVADAIQEFTKSQFDNLLYDCLQERERHHFSDWAYYQMLLTLTDQYFGKHTNEATLALAFLYSQSGYKMRLAQDGNSLYMLMASRFFIYDKSFFYIGGQWYYLLDGRSADRLKICEAAFPKESSLSLQITAQQRLEAVTSVERTITSQPNEDFSFTIKLNKNYMDFYETYPSSCIDQNFMTRWAIYAETPLEKNLTDQLYPQMRQKLEGLSKLDAVQQLLWWVQTGFEYKFDEEVWGYDRPFFGEESLFYPYCDCEDRSILLSHLVRELVGLDVVLVYYPGHLAMAVNFDTDVEGDYIMLDGRKFIVCDPTYIFSQVGQTMPEMSNESATVILLNKEQAKI